MKYFYSELRKLMDQLALGDEKASQWLMRSKVISSISRIPGDASARKYYRVTSESKSFILMSMGPFVEQQSELPFLTVQKHLKRSGVDVPEVLDVDPERGLIVLEDLGDVTLLRELQRVSAPDTERHLYERVIDALINLQINASRLQNEVVFEPFKLKFDHEKLMWEVNFTIENFYKIYLKRDLAAADLEILQEGLSEICSFLANQPTVLTHRDFHSRNIMVALDRLVMIDFQDARMGPPQYDLVSLLKDSYYPLEDFQISFLMDYYIARFEAMGGKPIERASFIEAFDLMAVQRNFKAIGSFASFMNRRGDPTYLKYIGNTFENIRRTLLKYPRYSRLREVLFYYYCF